MAYDSLKALIRQYIKTNGEQEITGQILQNVLVEMVNQYPSTDGYATQSWVTSQGYATTSQLADYLPLAGGTIKGSSNDYKVNILPNGISVQYSDVSSDTDTITEISSTGIYFKETEEEFIRIYKYSTQLRIQLEEGDYASLRAGSFIKNGGTSAQFLKADGSVDSNTYVTASALTGYATQSWVTTQLGNYLPLTGGTIKGSSNDYKVNILPNGISVQYSDVSSDTDTITEISSTGIYFKETEEEFIRIYKYSTQLRIQLEEGDYASLRAGSFIKNGGTSAQFLKADGSVDSNTYLPKQGSSFYFITDADMPETAANISTLNAAHRMTLYRNAILMPYQMNDANDGGFIRSRGTSESSAIMEIGMWDDAGAGETIQFNYYPTTSTINPTYSVTVPKKSGTIALTSDLASYNPTTNFKTINNQSIIGTGNINIEGGGGTLYDAEVEYLECTGTQYIDTLYKPSKNSEFDIQFYWTANLSGELDGTQQCLFGLNDNGPWANVMGNYGSSELNWAACANVGAGLVRNQVCNVSLKGNVITRPDGATYTVSKTYSAVNRNLYLLCRNQNGPTRYCNGARIYYAKFWENGTLIHDFIPVRVGQVGYLYDKVSGQLFGNSGTGDFVLGQDTGPGGGLPYLPLTGGTITGNLTVKGTLTASDGYLNIYSVASNHNTIFEFTDSQDVIFSDGGEYFFNAQINAPGFVNTSDLRKKTIMGDVPMNIYNVANAPLFKFTWKDEKKYSGQHIGSAAQYWQTILPELVSIGRDADMTLAMQYDVIALASAITVAKTVVNHEERIILLERENEALKKEIADLKSA